MRIVLGVGIGVDRHGHELLVSQRRLEEGAQPVLVEIRQLGGQIGVRLDQVVGGGYVEAAAHIAALGQLACELADLGLLCRHPHVEVHRRAQAAQLVRAKPPREIRQRQAARDGLRLLLLGNMGLQFERAGRHSS